MLEAWLEVGLNMFKEVIIVLMQPCSSICQARAGMEARRLVVAIAIMVFTWVGVGPMPVAVLFLMPVYHLKSARMQKLERMLQEPRMCLLL